MRGTGRAEPGYFTPAKSVVFADCSVPPAEHLRTAASHSRRLYVLAL